MIYAYAQKFILCQNTNVAYRLLNLKPYNNLRTKQKINWT